MSGVGRFASLFACLALASCASSPQAQRDSHLTAMLGARRLSDSEWKPVERQDVFAIDFDLRPSAWPVWLVAAIAAGGASNETDSHDWQSASAELDLGVRRYFASREGRVQPFVSGGVAWIYGRNEEPLAAPGPTTETVRDESLAGWIELGVSFPHERWHWGLAARELFGSTRDTRGPSDSDYVQLGAFIGFAF